MRNPKSGLLIAAQMEDIVFQLEEDDSEDRMLPTEIMAWRYRQQSVYSRSYLLSLNVGQDRPKTPSNKVICEKKNLNQNYFELLFSNVDEYSLGRHYLKEKFCIN